MLREGEMRVDRQVLSHLGTGVEAILAGARRLELGRGGGME